MSGLRYGLCPQCKSPDIRRPNTNYRCKPCGFKFAHPINPDAYARQSKGKSGIIAPLSYRQQLARSILLDNADATDRIDAQRSQTYFGRESAK